MRYYRRMLKRVAFKAFSSILSWLFGTPVAKLIWKIPGSRALYRQLMTRLRPDTVTVDGHVLHLDPLDSLLLSVNGSYEDFELGLFTGCLSEGDTVLDIGGHIGLYTLPAARKVGPNGRVIVFEPGQANFALLKQNVTENGYHNVTLVQAAVSDSVGETHLMISVDNTGDNSLSGPTTAGRASETVRMVTIDSFMADLSPRVDMVKIDIQGGEPGAMRGAHQTLMAQDDVLLFTELSPAHMTPTVLKDYLADLTSLGFQLHVIDEAEHRLVPRDTEDIARECASTVDTAFYLNLVGAKGPQALAKLDRGAALAGRSSR
jgi:FkbM family methyltransferase